MPKNNNAETGAVPSADVLTDEQKTLRLILALNKVQAALSAAKKDATNPHFKSKYATLASVWEAARKPLTDNGFAVVQIPVMQDAGAVSLHTILYHIDGANIDCMYPVVYGPCIAPLLGAALKYARRYSLETVIGITTDDDIEDDDGNKAPAPPPPARMPGARPTLQDQATAYITAVEAAKTWDDFMGVIAQAGDLVERIRAADKSGKWITKINEVVEARRDALEPQGDTQQEVPAEQADDKPA